MEGRELLGLSLTESLGNTKTPKMANKINVMNILKLETLNNLIFFKVWYKVSCVVKRLI